MTDVMPETDPSMEQEKFDSPGSSFPEYPDNPHNHRITVSFDPHKPPFFVVRASTAEELKAAFAELETSGAYAAAGSAYDSLKRQGAIGAGIPSPAPQGPPAPPQVAAVVQGQFSQQPAQQFPGAPGTAPAAWQNAGAPAPAAVQDNTAEYRQAGWYKLIVPFKPQGGNPGKPAFDALVAQYGMRKGRPTEGGQVSFNKANTSWHIAPEAIAAFGQFSPVPA